MKRIRKLVLAAINRAGYDLVRPDPEPRGFNARHLASVARPRTVFDVGVASGTPPLYEAWPEARFILVEPVEAFAPDLARLGERYDCRVYQKAVGRTAGFFEMTVDVDDPEKSSLAVRTAVTARDHALVKKRIEVTTLDAILHENPDLEPPFLLKLDTEGHELEALRGASDLLEVTDTVIAEVSVAERFEGGYRFEDMVAFMAERGFRFTDILQIAHARGEPMPRHMDVVFTKQPVLAATRA